MCVVDFEMRLSSIAVTIVVGCSHPHHAPPPSNTAPISNEGTCSTRCADFKAYLHAVFDPSSRPQPPWSTGDAATDQLIAEQRSAAQPHPIRRGVERTPAFVRTSPAGALAQALEPCVPAAKQLATIRSLAPDRRAEGYLELADRIDACGCNVNLPLVRGLVYISQRGPD
jgi:hypothetical protein